MPSRRLAAQVLVGDGATQFAVESGFPKQNLLTPESEKAWKQWLELQKMLVNENRFNLADKKARDYLAQQMEKHFFGAGADAAQGYIPPSDK